jgi:hypothetical protein
MSDLSRRHFLRTSGAVGAVLLPSLVLSDRAQATGRERFPKIWDSADILIGNSPADQAPGLSITCPMFLPGGRFANASHSLDLSGLGSGVVHGDITWDGHSIAPDFSHSLAFTTTTGTDGHLYLLTAAEAEVAGGQGRFRDVTQAIVRCKYKAVLGPGNLPLLVACVDCVAILVHN